MFGLTRRSQPHPGEIPIFEICPDLPVDAFELARFWVNSERSNVAIGLPDRWEPELLGSLLVESVHTAAAAYAAKSKMSEQEALNRIWSGFEEERERVAAEDSGETH